MQLLVKSCLQGKCSGLEIRSIHAIRSPKKWLFAIEAEHISRVTSDITSKNLQVLAYITFRQKINEAETKLHRNSQLLNFWNKNPLFNCSLDCEMKRPLQQGQSEQLQLNSQWNVPIFPIWRILEGKKKKRRLHLQGKDYFSLINASTHTKIPSYCACSHSHLLESGEKQSSHSRMPSWWIR